MYIETCLQHGNDLCLQAFGSYNYSAFVLSDFVESRYQGLCQPEAED